MTRQSWKLQLGRPSLTLWPAAVIAVALAVTIVIVHLAPLFHPRPKRVLTAGANSIPTVRVAELWYATTPAPGVWAELKIVLDYPGAVLEPASERTTLIVPASVFQDFRLRSTEPALVAPPRPLAGGGYALVFPAPLSHSWNWFRLQLEARSASPRPVRCAFQLIEGKRSLELDAVPVAVYYSDRQADPFMDVPTPLLRWLPGPGRAAFVALLGLTLFVSGAAVAGCAAAFWNVRHAP